jgi:hypothetical protein
MQSTSTTKATVSLTEDYPARLTTKVDSCTNIQGVVNITNSLGEDDADNALLTACRETCPMDVFVDSTIKTSFVTICAVNIPEGSRAEIACPNNGTISNVLFAHYGSKPSGACVGGFTYNSATGCRSPQTDSVVKRECLSKQRCSILSDSTKFGGDNCNGSANFLTIQAVCRVETVVYDKARVEVELRVGYPNRLAPYFKTFVTRMNVLGYIDDIVIVCTRLDDH